MRGHDGSQKWQHADVPRSPTTHGAWARKGTLIESGCLAGSRASGVKVVVATRVFYAAAMALLVASMVWVARVAPTRLSVHFAVSGEPNGFMTRGVYVGFVLGLAVLVCVIVPVAMVAGARRGHRVSGIGHAGFWSRRENRALYVERLTNFSLFAGAVCAVTVSGSNAMILSANGAATAPLSPWMGALIVVPIAAALVWAYHWYGRLPR